VTFDLAAFVVALAGAFLAGAALAAFVAAGFLSAATFLGAAAFFGAALTAPVVADSLAFALDAVAMIFLYLGQTLNPCQVEGPERVSFYYATKYAAIQLKHEISADLFLIIGVVSHRCQVLLKLIGQFVHGGRLSRRLTNRSPRRTLRP